jgi:hypothetical protein
VKLARSKLPQSDFQGPLPTGLRGAAEALKLTIATPAPAGGRILQRQIYGLSSGLAGVLTELRGVK